MKQQAFIRENLHEPALTDFHKFTYFLWAPTLIYRHQYPRQALVPCSSLQMRK